MADCFRTERERWPLWAPVLIGIGIAGYFTLGSEPPVWLGGLFVFVAAGFLWSGRGHNATVLFSLAFGLTAIGFSEAQLRTHLVAVAILERPMTGALSARVLQVEAFASGPRILLDNIRLRNHPSDGTPERVRLRLRAADLPEVWFAHFGFRPTAAARGLRGARSLRFPTPCVVCSDWRRRIRLRLVAPVKADGLGF